MRKLALVMLCSFHLWQSPTMTPHALGQALPDAEVVPVADLLEDTADAEAAPANDTPPLVRLVRVPLPIQGSVDIQVRRSVEQILSNATTTEQRPTIILEFAVPANGTGESSEFGRALDLARFLVGRDASRGRMVAYLPETVRGHAVLVALACEEIMMHPDARIGEAGVAESDIDETMRQAYREIAGRRRTVPPAIAVGFLDPQVTVQRLTTTQGTRYALARDVNQIQAETNVQKIDTVVPAGEPGLLAGDKLRLDYGFVSHLVSDRKELAAALNVPASTLELDPLLTGEWNAVRVDLHGSINPVLVDQTLRSMEDALQGDPAANFICLAIDSPGGSLTDSLRLATYLSGLDATKVRTVAYVPREARADAALVALACDQVIVEGETILGGGGAANFTTDDIESAAVAYRAMRNRKDRTWSLPIAMIDADQAIHAYQWNGTGATEYFAEQELREQKDPDAWQRGDEVCPAGELLQLVGEQALEYRIADHVVADYAEFQQTFQLEEPPRELEPNWAQELIGALANRRLATILLMVGFFSIMIEAQSPGLGFGGFVASICFLLFFWSNFLNGTAGWLEVLLFLMGLIFVAMELLVLPGFGIFGLGGGILIIASLILASQTFVIPRNEYQMQQLPGSLLMVTTAMLGVGVGAVAFHRYFGESALMRRFMLMPAEGQAADELRRREAVVQYDHLLGQQGKTTTQLTPSGKAEFEGELYDVVSDGLLIPRSTEVKVIEVVGNKIVVREVKA